MLACDSVTLLLPYEPDKVLLVSLTPEASLWPPKVPIFSLLSISEAGQCPLGKCSRITVYFFMICCSHITSMPCKLLHFTRSRSLILKKNIYLIIFMINSTLYQNPYSNTIDLNVIYESPTMCQILETEQ